MPGWSTRSFLTNKAMQSLHINQGPTMSGRLGTRHSSNTTLQIWMLCDVDTGEPLTSSNAASNHVNDRPTSQRRAVCQLCFLQSLTAADDDFLDFSHDDIFFHQHFRSQIHIDDDRALHDLSADSTMTSLLPVCQTVSHAAVRSRRLQRSSVSSRTHS